MGRLACKPFTSCEDSIMAAIRNKKRVFYSSTLSEVGRALLGKREDIEAVAFPAPLTGPDFVKLIGAGGETHGAILGGTRFGEAECEAAQGLQVVARIGVGFDAIDVPALSRRKVPLMTVGIANSPSVAEQAMHMMLSLAKRGAELNTLVAEVKRDIAFANMQNAFANVFASVGLDPFDNEKPTDIGVKELAGQLKSLSFERGDFGANRKISLALR